MTPLPHDKLALASKLMNVTKTLAEIQARNPHTDDRKGFNTAHYGLGLILAAMWEDPSMTEEQHEIVKGAAFLLWRHKRQASSRGISEKMIGVFLPGIDWWRDHKIKAQAEAVRALASRRLIWEMKSDPRRLVITGVGSNPNAASHLRAAARHCGAPLEQLFGTWTLTVEESKIGRLMQFAAMKTSFRGLFPIGTKFDFDKLSLRYPSPANNHMRGSSSSDNVSTPGPVHPEARLSPTQNTPATTVATTTATPIEQTPVPADRNLIATASAAPQPPSPPESGSNIRQYLLDLLHRLFIWW